MLTQLLVFAIVAQFLGIRGQVRDRRTLSAIPLAVVELRNMQTPVERQYTDSEGRFYFRSAPGGRYSIFVAHGGYETLLADVDAPTPEVVIELVRKQAATSPAAVISVREYMTPEKARREFEIGRREVRRQNCSGAIGHFENGLRVFGEDASAHNDAGNCYRQLGQLDRAEAAFKRATALSNSVYVYLNLAEVYTAQGRLQEAENVVLEAIRKNPKAGDAYYGLMLVYGQQGRVEDAQAAAFQADKYPHQIADVHLVLAEIYLEKQQPKEVAKHLELYLKEAPNGAHSARVRELLGR